MYMDMNLSLRILNILGMADPGTFFYISMATQARD